jgi:hypothetical protein
MTDEVRHTIFNASHLNGGLTTLLVALVEDQILLMGGNYNFVDSPASSPEPNFFALNLNTTFPVYGLIDSGSLWATPAPGVAPYQYGVFFYDNTAVHLYAGLGNSNVTDSNRLWAYDVQGSPWKQVDVDGETFQVGNRVSGAIIFFINASMAQG